MAKHLYNHTVEPNTAAPTRQLTSSGSKQKTENIRMAAGNGLVRS
jgi:hypothetical protein